MSKYNLAQLKTAEKLHDEAMKDPEYRREWERTAFARANSELVVSYRVEHNLSQTEFAKLVELSQGNVSRLESGDHNPNIDTLAHLAEVLSLEIVLDIVPANKERKGLSQSAKNKELGEFTVANSRVSVSAV